MTSTLSCGATVRRNVLTTCTLTVRNAGPGTAQHVTALVVLPRSLRLVAVSAGGTRARTVALWKLAPLAAGASVVLTVTVKPATTGKAVVAAAAFGTTPDPYYFNNFAVSRVSVTR